MHLQNVSLNAKALLHEGRTLLFSFGTPVAHYDSKMNEFHVIEHLYRDYPASVRHVKMYNSCCPEEDWCVVPKDELVRRFMI